MSNILKTPDNASVIELLRVQKRYGKPKNAMESFILYGANAALKERDRDHAEVRGIDLQDEGSPDSYRYVESATPEEFDSVIAG